MKESYVGVIIADIHFGAQSSEKLYDELNKNFLSYINKMKILDFVIIAGDLFDSKISLNSDHVNMVFRFIKELMCICVKKCAKLRIIKGTESHDNQQLQVLRHMTASNCDFKIINTVEAEDLFENMYVLYVPEEYVKDPNEYYKEYFNRSYDMVFGHGMFTEVAFAASYQKSEVTMNKAPVFKSKEFINICRGPIFFGHIHKSQCIKHQIYYTGSFSRWSFGEDEPKGFMMVGYTPETSAFKVEFIENKDVNDYVTMAVGDESTLYDGEPADEIHSIVNWVNSNPAYRKRLIFNIPEDYDKSGLLIQMISDVFGKHRDVKVIINNNSKEQKKKNEMDNKIQTMMKTYDFIFDKGINPEDKLSRYVKVKYNRDIPVDKMRSYLYDTINGK